MDDLDADARRDAAFRFVLDSHTVCTAPDGTVRWEADTEPVTVGYEDLSPELKPLADRVIEEARRGTKLPKP